MTPVTRRYASNLLKKGKNNEYIILELKHQYTNIEDLVIGFYYEVQVAKPAGEKTFGIKQQAVGVTPLQAVERCLEKHGVTFR